MKKKRDAKSAFFKLAHIAIVVRDLDKAVERLTSMGIGPFHAPRKFPPLKKPLLYRGKPWTGENRLLVTKIGDVEIEVFQPINGDSPQMEFLKSKGEGIHHLGFYVDDRDRELAKLTKPGQVPLHEAEWEGGKGGYFELLVGGLTLELMQMPPDWYETDTPDWYQTET